MKAVKGKSRNSARQRLAKVCAAAAFLIFGLLPQEAHADASNWSFDNAARAETGYCRATGFVVFPQSYTIAMLEKEGQGISLSIKGFRPVGVVAADTAQILVDDQSRQYPAYMAAADTLLIDLLSGGGALDFLQKRPMDVEISYAGRQILLPMEQVGKLARALEQCRAAPVATQKKLASNLVLKPLQRPAKTPSLPAPSPRLAPATLRQPIPLHRSVSKLPERAAIAPATPVPVPSAADSGAAWVFDEEMKRKNGLCVISGYVSPLRYQVTLTHQDGWDTALAVDGVTEHPGLPFILMARVTQAGHSVDYPAKRTFGDRVVISLRQGPPLSALSIEQEETTITLPAHEIAFSPADMRGLSRAVSACRGITGAAVATAPLPATPAVAPSEIVPVVVQSEPLDEPRVVVTEQATEPPTAAALEAETPTKATIVELDPAAPVPGELAFQSLKKDELRVDPGALMPAAGSTKAQEIVVQSVAPAVPAPFRVDETLAEEWAEKLSLLQKENSALRAKAKAEAPDAWQDIRVDSVAKIREKALEKKVRELQEELQRMRLEVNIAENPDEAAEFPPALPAKNLIDKIVAPDPKASAVKPPDPKTADPAKNTDSKQN